MKEQKRRQGRPHISKTFWHGLTAIMLLAYLVAALVISSEASAERRCAGMRIAVNDTTEMKFVTAPELARELGEIPSRAKGMRILDIDTDSIERILSRVDKIESARAVKLSDGYVLVSVDPMRPVARVFDGGKSYYINKEGKRISADARYHIDVPGTHHRHPAGRARTPAAYRLHHRRFAMELSHFDDQGRLADRRDARADHPRTDH